MAKLGTISKFGSRKMKLVAFTENRQQAKHAVKKILEEGFLAAMTLRLEPKGWSIWKSLRKPTSVKSRRLRSLMLRNNRG